MVLKTKKKRQRTDKVFVEYNDYHDRPFGLKWGTAFAIDELNKVINENKANDNKQVKLLPVMDRNEIDEILQLAFLKTLKVSVQLNEKDENGNYYDNITGYFKGFADSEFVYIEHTAILWESIRNIQLFDLT